MRSVKINKFNLLNIVNENKLKHIDNYNESVEDYKILALKIAKDNLSLAKSGEIDKITKIKVLPPAPVSHEKDYDKALRMLDLSVDTEIEIEEDIFNQLVLDEWGWKTQFISHSTLYKTML